MSVVMDGYCILLLILFGSCRSEWVLLPSVFPKEAKFKNQFSHRVIDELSLKYTSYNNTEFCPDFHNLTTMSYGTIFKEEIQSRNGEEISLEDVEELLEENRKLPKTSREKANLVKQMGDNLMIEAEQQIKTLFSPRREARTKSFHFPSMESALMTISMLLFGVYLSKLILKLLLSHYNRYNGGVTMMTGIRTPITLAHARTKRSTQLLKIHLMDVIDKYESQFN